MNRSFILILMIVVLAVAACRGEGEADEGPAELGVVEAPKEEIFYSLTADVYPNEGGLVYPAEAEVPAGEMIEVEAVPVPGYEFEGWSGASSISAPNLSLTMDGDKQLTAHFKVLLTPTPEPTLTPTSLPCKNPSEVADDDVGNSICVCGKVTSFAPLRCINCPHGYYTFIKLENQFRIISYEWSFLADWVGAGICVEDTVELFGEDPVFVFSIEEGKEGVDCDKVPMSITVPKSLGGGTHRGNEYRCPVNDYFMPCSTCEDSHFYLPEIVYIPTRIYLYEWIVK